MKWLHQICARPSVNAGPCARAVSRKWFVGLVLILVALPMPPLGAQQKIEKIRLTVPAKSLTFIPFYFGKAQGMYAREGIDLEIVVMRPPLGVTALVAGDLDYSAA